MCKVKRIICFFIFFLLAQWSAFAQLPDFNLTVTTTDETCSGNGALVMSVSNTEAGATITYSLFLLPDSTNPIAETTTSSFNSLPSGDYIVVATQTLGSDENSQQQEVTINDVTTTLDYDISHSTTSNCDEFGTITVNILSGNPVSYEIISGPQTVAPQSSNIFTGLPQGTYIVRVYDDCDNALSKTYTMLLDINDLEIGEVALPIIYDNCDEANVEISIDAAEDTTIIYPLSVTLTVFSPDGSPEIVFNQNITSGDDLNFTINQLIPLFGSDSFDVNVLIVDSCGLVFESDQIVNPNPKVNLTTTEEFCGEFLNVAINNYLPPFTLSFTSAPSGFDPSDYNESYPGPFTQDDGTIIFGFEENPVPTGMYTVQVVDACNRVGAGTIFVDEVVVDPLVITSNSGCTANSGIIEIRIPEREVITATIISAPSSFPETLPFNADEFIVGDILSIQGNNLPAGDYVITVVDNCGIEYTLDANIPVFQFQGLSVLTLPNCETETGSLNLSSNHGQLSEITIVSAPSAFAETIPFDATSLLDGNGSLFMNNLPVGDYQFESSDTCNFDYTTNVTINSYTSNPFAYTLTRNCGSFDVTINDADQTVTNQTYWLQYYFEDSDTWGHPNTGVAYTEGDIPNSTTAIEIENMETLYNIFLTGDFRLIKVFQSINSENPDVYCLDEFANFTVYSDLVISGVYNLNCSGGGNPSDVVVEVIGVAPFNYSIISPITIDNGSNNIFSGLPNGTYEIKVEDACGSIENITVNLENLLPLVRANTPDNFTICKDDGVEQEVFQLDTQNEQILGNQNPNNYTITYHLSQSDADSGNNPLPNQFTNNTNPQTVYARVVHNNLALCHATTSFQIYVGQVPVLSEEETVYICPDGTVTLIADSGFDAYLWSTQETTQSITVDQAGTYTVTIIDEIGDFYCESTKSYQVINSEPATIESIEISDWTANNNTIAVMVSGSGNYVYSLDGINYQTQNTFFNLQPGEYAVYVKDNNGCGIIDEDVYLLNYPKFFTPNGDDINEFWQIKFASLEPGLEVFIFDRYGKLLKQFGSQDAGWDGTYNGNTMPTNDYWFVVNRANGLTYKGHFTLKR